MSIRFSLLFRGDRINQVSCTVVYGRKFNDFTEFWFKCSDIYEFLNLLNSLASLGAIYSIGTLRGDIYRSLPSYMYDLINSLSYDMVLEPGTAIQCRVLRDLSDNLVLLAKHSSKVAIRPKGGVVKAYLVKPLHLGVLFDSGIRLLKPYKRPPELI